MWPNKFFNSVYLLLESLSSYFLIHNIITISCDIFGTHPIDLDFIEINVCKQRYFFISFNLTFELPLFSALIEYDNHVHSSLK